MDFADFVKFSPENELTGKFELRDKRGFELTEKRRADSCPPAHPHSQTEHDIHGKGYFHRPAGAACLAVLCPSSCPPAH